MPFGLVLKKLAPASLGGEWSHRESLAAFYSFPYLRRFPGHFVWSCLNQRFSRMPLGDCTAIFFSSPAFTMVLSFIILKWVVQVTCYKRMKPFTFPLQGSLWFSTCLNSSNSADRGLFWKLSSSNLLTFRCWSCPGRLPSFQALCSPSTMSLSTIWSGTQPSAGLTPVKCLYFKDLYMS